MMIIPAIDILDGKCVRLTQGRSDSVKIYSDDPVGLAKSYFNAGVERIHVVDLDGAFTGNIKSICLIEKIALLGRIQVGGGIRTEEQIVSILESGVEKVVVSSILFTDSAPQIKKKYYGKLVGSFDFKGAKLCYNGWVSESSKSFSEVSANLDEIIITDIERDGTMQGPNIELLSRIKTEASVIAAGGVRNISDIKQLEKIPVNGVILGKALLEWKVRLEDCLKC